MATPQAVPEAPSTAPQPGAWGGPVKKPNRWPQKSLCAICLLLADALTIAVCFGAAILVHHRAALHLTAQSLLHAFRIEDYLTLAWAGLLLLVFMTAGGLYTRRRTQWSEIGSIVKAVGMGSIAVMATVLFARGNRVFSRSELLAGGLLVVLLPLTRYLVKKLLFVSGLWRKRILILGTAESAVLAMGGVCDDPILGYEPVGLLDDDPHQTGATYDIAPNRQVKVLGRLSEAEEWMRRTRAEDIMIAPGLGEDRVLSLILRLQPLVESIVVIPEVWALPMTNLEVDALFRERVLLLKLHNNLAKPWNFWVKRAFDLVLSSLLLLIVLPVFLVVAVLVRLDSKGPALFVQERLGRRGRRFRCLKFRTMYLDGPTRLARYLEQNPAARIELFTYAKLRGFDPRVTRIGSFLRHWSLDELPQLINVFKGDMSFVGPRPYLLIEGHRMAEHLPIILSTRPGMSGLWQVNGRNQITFDNRVQLEEWYVRHWSLWLDCVVLIKTFRAIFRPGSKAQAPARKAGRAESTPDTANSKQTG